MEAREQRVLESLASAVVTLDGEGTVVLVNAAAEDLFAAPRGALLGQPAEALLPGRLRERLRTERASFLAARRTLAGLELAILRRDGSEREVELSLSVSEGPLVTALLTDTAARRRLQSQLVEAQKLESIGRLAAGVAHDFNNALTTISGYAHLVLSRVAPGDAVHDDVRQIVRAVEDAGRLVTQLQAFSRGERVEVQIVDLNQSVRDVGRLLEVVLGEKIALELRLEPRLPGVEANLGALEQAVMQLALNARDAMPAGGWLLIETAVAATPGGPEVRFTISDTGCGMGELTRRRAFEPFFTTKSGAESAGLGLTTVYVMAERLRGRVDLASTVGEGTTVTLALPAVEQQPGGLPARGPATLGTVLMVEDEETLRELVGRILADEGYTVLTAASGEEALALSTREPGRIDLLVSDVVLGGMTGPELAARLRARRPGLKTLLMSGYAGMPLGNVDDFLAKPFSPFELARRIRKILRP